LVKLNARLITATPEDVLGYCARVSNPANQDNPDYSGLLRYCVKNKHWSVFEMATAIVEVEAPRDISRQLLRHRSFSFQEFSQRYSDAINFTEREFREQDTKNRQNSTNTLDGDIVEACEFYVGDVLCKVEDSYFDMIKMGVAKECARVVLPEGLTMSKLYVSGTLRSWIHYLDVRDDPGVTQHEHVMLARKIREALLPAFPITLDAITDEPRLL
jgi:thymidylate synthase (FAD)